jgi:hypothetical protein
MHFRLRGELPKTPNSPVEGFTIATHSRRDAFDRSFGAGRAFPVRQAHTGYYPFHDTSGLLK